VSDDEQRRLDQECGFYDGGPRGTINPSLLVFNNAVRHRNIVRMVRRWVVDQPLIFKPRDPQGLACKIICDARARIGRFKDQPLEALAKAAVIGTIVYRGTDVAFPDRVAKAAQQFSSRL
jgi:hypothetical protein